MPAKSKSPLPRDDGLEWLREIRRTLAAEANFDPVEMGKRLRAREALCPERVWKGRTHLVREETPVVTGPAAQHEPYDDELEWLRKIRRDMLAEVGNDPTEMGRRLRLLEQDYKDRMIRLDSRPQESAKVAEEPPEDGVG